MESINQVSENSIQTVFDKINQSIVGVFAEFIGNITTLGPIVIFLVSLFIFLLSFKKRANRISKSVIEALSKNGKYIRGLFVELNDTKELTRYFLYGYKWKNRIIKDYNTLFDDENGRHLTKIYKNYNIRLRLRRTTSIDKICSSIDELIALLKKIEKREIATPEEYKETATLFEVYGNRYVEKLQKLKNKVEFARKRYIILTGSAGNGKTNLLCSLAELVMSTGKICIFINTKEVSQNIDLYLEEKLMGFGRKYFKVYWWIQNFICVLLRKKIYIIIDAVNEDESKKFVESLPDFINNTMRSSNVKTIISCRSEYFDLKYRNILVDNVDEVAFCYDIMKEQYSIVAKERMYENYKKAFNFSGTVSSEVKEKLYKQLLLMRMFFEVNRNSNATVINLNKYEIFQRYIDSVMKDAKQECDIFLCKVVEQMCKLQVYSAVYLSPILKENQMSCTIRDFVDESILLSRKLVLHPNSIIETHEEEIYFVFDEMRDYCVARYVLNNLCADAGNPVEKRVIAFLDKLVAEKSVCAEGVINYIYWFYKGQGNADMCKLILHSYMKQHDQVMEPYRMNRESGLSSWGLKVIFESNDSLCDYEKEYIQFIVEENPGNELSRMVEYLIHQEKLKRRHNLDVFLNPLFDIHEVEKFCTVLKESVSSWNMDGISISDFIEIDKSLKAINPDGCKRFRYFLFLFLNFLNWEGKAEVQEYFEQVCDVESIRHELTGKVYFDQQEVENDDTEVQ